MDKKIKRVLEEVSLLALLHASVEQHDIKNPQLKNENFCAEQLAEFTHPFIVTDTLGNDKSVFMQVSRPVVQLVETAVESQELHW